MVRDLSKDFTLVRDPVEKNHLCNLTLESREKSRFA
jgi:hypothetical protein